MNFDIDIAIVVGFLIVTLVVGFRHGSKIKTIEDYALGGRNFSTAALVSTIVATWVSGSGFFIILSQVYSQGFSYLVSDLGFLLSPLILVFIFIPRMTEFLGKNSIAEAMGGLYGKNVRIIIAIAGVIGSSGSVAIQFNVFGNIVSYLTGISGNVAILVAGIIVTTYSAFGGIKSVTFTDILQFFTFGTIIPLLGTIIWNHAHNTSFTFTTALQYPKFNYKEILSTNNSDFWYMVALFFYFAIPHMKPAWFQRVSMGSNIQQIKKAFTISTLILFLVMFVIAWIPFLIWNINPTITPEHLVSYIIDNYTYPGLKGFIIIAITAMAMSTADSYINASSVLFSNDFCKPLNIGKKDNERDLLLSRTFALILGLGAIVLASTTNDLLGIMILANSFYFPVITPVLFLTILGFRSSTKTVLIGMGTGLTTIVIWKILGMNKISGVMFAVVINLVTFMASHYLLKQKGGWIKIKDSTDLDQETTTRKISNMIQSIRMFNLIASCKKCCPKDELT